MDVTQFPCNQDANKQQYRKTNPKRQGSRHVVGLGFTFLLVLFTASQHEKQGCAQAAQNSDEPSNCNICHSLDYRVRLKTLNFRFWLLTSATIAATVITLKLGMWQLSRANQKLALQAVIQQQTSLPALNASVLLQSIPTDVLHRTITLTGHWLPQHILFLDNRQMDSKPGLFVLTPFEFTDATTLFKKTILVQRGWLPRNFLDRNKLPEVATETSEVTLVGRIALSPSKLFEFKGTESGALRQNIELEALAKELKLELLPFSLLQLDTVNANAAKGERQDQPQDQLLRRWAQPNYGSEKNYGYMVQWWALSALIALLYVWFQLIRPHIKCKTTQKNKTENTDDE